MRNTRSRSVRRGDLWYLFFALLTFAYLLALTSVRLSYKERNGEIEILERTLKERRTDEAYLRTELHQTCGYVIVQRIAREEWGMGVATSDQHLLLAAAPREDAVDEPDRARDLWSHLLDVVPPSVARASVAQAPPAGARGDRVARTN